MKILVLTFKFSMLALIRDSIKEQPCLFHLMLSPSLETFLIEH